MDNRLSTELAKFEAVFYGSEAPLVIFMGPDMIYEMLNDSYQAIYPGRELIGKSIFEVIPELAHSAFPAILKKVYDTGINYVSHEGLAHIKNKNGQIEERYFDTTFSRIDYGNGEMFRILANPKEVTDKVLSRKKLEQSLAELEAEKELREKFVSALTHDLRTPLTAINLCAGMLKTKSNDPEIVDKCVNRILNSSERADRMIHDLLDANRLKANQELPVSLEQHELEDILARTMQDLEGLYKKRFVVENSVGKISVHWDNMAIQRLIENLAINAIKYGSENTPVTISIKRDGDWLEVRVHNLGNPIAIEDQQLLFQPYKRSASAQASKQKGWGIGLSLVQGLARAHNGNVSLESDSNHGTTFTARLPIDARLGQDFT
ncbi:hypothetical protein CIK05_09600 [Bdellovibrio sp. qaytius]|nr:hypothetical protein CIK05_09600 [Bdellovibrio sp. qaytius]